jgi:NitT/TauT family transport system ATP-binding protein
MVQVEQPRTLADRVTASELPGIDLAGVSVKFGQGASAVVALDGCNLHIRRGERVALLGPSGCGKSTLLRVVADLLEPSSGRVSVHGRTAAEVRRDRSYMLVAQSSTLLQWRTLQRNVELAAEIAGVPRNQRKQRAKQVIDLVGLQGFESYYPQQLSGGMRQRGSIARALSMSPDLLLLDEPFGALDEITRERLNFELMDVIAATQASMILVTHSIAEAIIMSETVHLMSPRPGRIIGTVHVPFAFPRHPSIRNTAEFHAIEGRLRDDLAVGMASRRP